VLKVAGRVERSVAILVQEVDDSAPTKEQVHGLRVAIG
jgi:hypothetical protein